MRGMAEVFGRVADEVERQAKGEVDDAAMELLRPLDHRARRVLGLFADQEFIQSSDVANLLGLSTRQARELISHWVEQDWLEIADPSRRGRKHRLSENYRELL